MDVHGEIIDDDIFDSIDIRLLPKISTSQNRDEIRTHMLESFEDDDLPLEIPNIRGGSRASLEDFTSDLFEGFRIERETNDAECP